MKIYLDTSALLKLYHKESGTKELLDFLSNNEINEITLSEIAKIEFSSAIWKKIRMKEIEKNEGLEVIKLFQKDFEKYSWIELLNSIVKYALNYLNKYGSNGLRTLDSLQLASANSLENKTNIMFITYDNILLDIFKQENLKCF